MLQRNEVWVEKEDRANDSAIGSRSRAVHTRRE